MRCWNCGAENPDRAKFCIECASPFARRCPTCNAENPPTAKFCLECAQPLQAGAVAATAKTPSKDLIVSSLRSYRLRMRGNTQSSNQLA
jgi:ribosomal protein L40E